MASPNHSALLNAETSQPDERQSENLQPKSYVDAVLADSEEASSSSVNGTSSLNGASENFGASQDDHFNGSKASTSDETDGGSVKEADQGDQGKRPAIGRQESKQEYSATGLDESPRTPPRHKRKKIPSQKANGTNTSSLKNEDTLVYENLTAQSNGIKLVSVKPAENHEKKQTQSNGGDLRVDEDNRTLVSGRQAGKRWETSGIRFAPMNIPLQRRLQTLVVLFHSTCIALSISTFFFLCAIPIFWPLLIPYMIYCMSSNAATSGTLRHRTNLVRSSSIWSLFASYFPARLHRSQELPPTRKYIFGYHPHGIISHGAWAAFGTEALGFSQLFPGITNTLLTLDSNFRIPIYRDYLLAMGLASVSRESCENLLSKGGKNNEGMGRAITIVVGGAAESLDAQPYSLRLVLKKRMGFVKMALRTGADLVPVMAFGENDLYDQVTSASHPGIHKVQLLIKKLLGFTIPLFHARGVFNYDVGLMPYRRPLNIVVGRPIKVTQSLQPAQEEIYSLHEQYVKELESIWNSWKDDFAKDRKGELEIVE